MLKKLVSLSAVLCFAACRATAVLSVTPEIPKITLHNMSREALFEKMKKAADPGNVAVNWKTMTVKMQMGVPMQQRSLAVTAMYKFPAKSKIVAEMPGIPVTTEVFNGTQAWKETAGLGIQMKTGVQLAFAEFDCKKANPALELTDIYKKVELDPSLYKVAGFSCYKLICYPPDKLNVPPSQLFIDDKEFLARYSIESQLSEMGVVQVAVDIKDYKIVEGVRLPMLMEINMLGIKMQAKILGVKINDKIPDTEFLFPENKDKTEGQ
ncbi:MAG: hypothetical protein PHV82_02555 [Victivallaceae bacterium]|nr:hypothetical protein [Victivallaceae bacterium]